MSKTTRQLSTILFTGLISATLTLSAGQVMADESRRHGQQGSEQMKGGLDNEARGEQMFARLDVDESGELSLNELLDGSATRAEKKFNRKDSDENGVLSLEEFSQNFRGNSLDLSAIADDIVLCVADLKADTDNDDIIVPSADDFTSMEDKFNAMDTSGDGELDLAEYQSAKAALVSDSFTLMDTDDSLSISLDEFTAFKATKYASREAICQCIKELIDEDTSEI